VLVAVPWYLYIMLHAGDVLREQFFGYEILKRFLEPPHGHTGPPGYYLLVALLAGALPWSALIPGAVLETWRERKTDGAARLLLVWFVLPWLVLELIPSKLPHYILPCYVPLAIMLGRMWDRGLQRPVIRTQRLVLGIWVSIPILIGAALLVIAATGRAGPVTTPVAAAGTLLLAGFVLTAVILSRRRLLAAFVAAIGATTAFQIVIGAWLLPALEPYRLSRQIAEQANARSRGDEQVLVCGYDEPTMFFYLQPPATIVPPAQIAAALKAADGRYLIIARQQDLATLGISPDEKQPGWSSIDGFNYVKWKQLRVWVARPPAPGDRR